MRLIWADGGYSGAALSEWVRDALGCRLDVVPRQAGQRGFAVLPQRWMVARTFGWLGRQRRLSKGYEGLPASSAAWVQIAMNRLGVAPGAGVGCRRLVDGPGVGVGGTTEC